MITMPRPVRSGRCRRKPPLALYLSPVAAPVAGSGRWNPDFELGQPPSERIPDEPAFPAPSVALQSRSGWTRLQESGGDAGQRTDSAGVSPGILQSDEVSG